MSAAEGETVPVGRVIIVIGEPGEKIEALPKPKEAKARPSVGVVGELEEAPEEEEVKRPVEKAPAKPVPAPPLKRGEILAVPMVRKLASDPSRPREPSRERAPRAASPKRTCKGRPGRRSRRKKEPEKAIKTARKYDLYGFIERIPLRGMRKTIAQAMVKSKSTIPHAAGLDEADVTQLLALKARAKERAAQKKIHLTILPFVIKAVVAALEEHPYVNASLDDENGEIVLKKYYSIGLAVDTKDGLMVPVVKNAKGKNIFQLAAELAELSEKARNRTIDLADLKGGTFHHHQFRGDGRDLRVSDHSSSRGGHPGHGQDHGETGRGRRKD